MQAIKNALERNLNLSSELVPLGFEICKIFSILNFEKVYIFR